MPRSTFSAVRTPGSDSPSSTRVMATAGRMPVTTVSASRTRAMAAMLASMRPMKESTTSRAEMSMRTPVAPLLRIWVMRSSCRVMASRSCMSTWMVMSRSRPILRIGIRSIRASGGGSGGDGQAVPLEGEGERVLQVGLGDDLAQLDPEVHDGLRDLGPDAADDAVRAHEPRRGDRLQQVLRDQGVHGGHAGDVDDGDGGAVVHDGLQQVLHHHLGARAVEGADEGQGQDALPQLHHRGGQLQQVLLLAVDDLLAALLELVHREDG